MRRQLLRGAGATAMLLGISVLAAAAQTPTLPAELGGWKRVEWRLAEVRELERLVGEQAALFREYGVRQAQQAVYRRGGTQWRVTLLDTPDRSSSYGLFTLLREGGSPVALGEAGARSRGRYLLFQWNYFVAVEWPGGWTELTPLARWLAKQQGSMAPLPSLPSFLPRQGLIAGSDCYLLGPAALAHAAPLAPGDWAGFAYGAEAEAARYRVDGSEALLVLISYPTPQIAAERLRDFQRLFNLNGVGDPLRRLAYAKRSGTLVALVAGLDSGQQASRLLEQVQYEAQLAWSDASGSRPPPNWVKTIRNLFIGTGLFVVYAFFSGLIFAVIRLLVKRWLPGKVFDRSEAGDIIVLNLQAKR